MGTIKDGGLANEGVGIKREMAPVVAGTVVAPPSPPVVKVVAPAVPPAVAPAAKAIGTPTVVTVTADGVKSIADGVLVSATTDAPVGTIVFRAGHGGEWLDFAPFEYAEAMKASGASESMSGIVAIRCGGKDSLVLTDGTFRGYVQGDVSAAKKAGLLSAVHIETGVANKSGGAT